VGVFLPESGIARQNDSLRTRGDTELGEDA